MKLDATAREGLSAAGITQAVYARWQGFPDGRWRGAACGCADPLCIGAHHSSHQPCGCMRESLAELLHQAEYRVNYAVQRRLPGEADYRDIGFGSTGGAATVDAAAYEMETNIQRQEWETSTGMPDPLSTKTSTWDEL